MPNIFKQIGRTIEGKTKVGKILHQALPAKKLRSAVGQAVLGIKKASPLPEFKDSAVRESINKADSRLRSLTGDGDKLDQATQLRDVDEEAVLNVINEVRDILDDGKMNESTDDLSPRTKKIIQQVFSAIPLLAYLAYAISTGDFSLGGFLDYVQMFFGL